MDPLNTKIKNIKTEKTNKVRPENIKQGVSIFGITGTYTNDANATANDILDGKTAYVNGEYIEGTLVPTVPTGTISITQNGTIDVTNYASANVNVSGTPSRPYMLMDFTDLGAFNLNYVAYEIGDLYCPNVYSWVSAFNGCIRLTSIGKITNSSSTTDISYMFDWCSALTSVDLSSFNTTNVTTMGNCFEGCSALTTLNLSNFNTKKVTYFKDMFNSCTNLETITFGSNFQMNAVTNTNNLQRMFTNCTHLSSTTLNNILGVLATHSNSASGTKTLKYIGLSSSQATTCTGLANWTTLQAKGWTTGY